ncbi:codeine O-demethylase-like [Malania oleifera]|uniref:codeine O-demethylase-like n=1 Tax=Malania oleifera TaxID=397392 RepID=UPI0025AE967B|nr:codeine O-demethylase-like [Malania oleifera]
MPSAGNDNNGRPVFSLQELTKEPLLQIPDCYVCEDEESTNPSQEANNISSPSLPTIDMKLLMSGEASELEKLHATCSEWGFFQLLNHGVSSSLIEKVKSEVEEFFNLPLEKKMEYKRGPKDVEGYGLALPPSSQDQKFDWGDRFYMVINPVHERKPHLFTQFPPSLRNALESYISELQKVGMELMGLLARALKMDLREMEEWFEDGMQSMRMTYYPPCPQPEKVMGLRSHTDGSAITILLQVNTVQGLQIKKDGVWIPVSFDPDAFVVNIGDILEIFSNGVYRSIDHRVTINPTEERISIAMFFNPKLEAEVGPARSLINPKNPPLFKTVGMQQYLNSFFSRQLSRKTNLEHMRIINGEDACLG